MGDIQTYFPSWKTQFFLLCAKKPPDVHEPGRFEGNITRCIHERLVITEQAWALFSFQNCDTLYCISQSFEENLVKKRMSISRICLGKCFTQQQQQQPDCVCFNRQGMLQCRASQHLDDKATKRHNTPGGKTVVYANRCSHSLLDAPDSLGAERYES